MEDEQIFNLSEARPGIVQALEEAGYDLINNPAEPNLIEARRDNGPSNTFVIVDGGGHLRFTATRQTGPEKAETYKIADAVILHVTRETSETLTVTYQLTRTEALNFVQFLTELDKI